MQAQANSTAATSSTAAAALAIDDEDEQCASSIPISKLDVSVKNQKLLKFCLQLKVFNLKYYILGC